MSTEVYRDAALRIQATIKNSLNITPNIREIVNAFRDAEKYDLSAEFDENKILNFLMGYGYDAFVHGDAERELRAAIRKAANPAVVAVSTDLEKLQFAYDVLSGQVDGYVRQLQAVREEAAYWKSYAEKLVRGDEVPAPLPDGSLPGPSVYAGP